MLYLRCFQLFVGFLFVFFKSATYSFIVFGLIIWLFYVLYQGKFDVDKLCILCGYMYLIVIMITYFFHLGMLAFLNR